MSAASWGPFTTSFSSAPVGAPPVPGLLPPPRDRQALIWRDPVPPGTGMGAEDPLWWWLGAHGGAGVSTLTSLMAVSADARRMWPGGHRRQSPNVVLVCRTHTEGLERVRDLAAQYTVRLVPPGVRLLGLVTVADAPGKLPTPLRRLRDLVSATVPHAWHLPWIEHWRGARLHELPLWHPDTGAPEPPQRGTPPVPVLPPAYLACAQELAARSSTTTSTQ
jgi:hypothetical protein